MIFQNSDEARHDTEARHNTFRFFLHVYCFIYIVSLLFNVSHAKYPYYTGYYVRYYTIQLRGSFGSGTSVKHVSETKTSFRTFAGAMPIYLDWD